MVPCSSKIELKLANQELWQKFPKPMEMMILMKTGRKLFPTLEYLVDGLDKDALYEVELHMERANDFRYIYRKNQWLESESDLSNTPTEKVKHSNGILTGEQWMADTICFESVRLTNDPNLKSPNHICVQSMHKWRPVVTIRKISSEKLEEGFEKEFRLEETCFIAVTVYHNRDLVDLKIDNNPMAAAYREQYLRRKNRVLILKRYQSRRRSDVFPTPPTTPGASAGLPAPANGSISRQIQPGQARSPIMRSSENQKSSVNGIGFPGSSNISPQFPMAAGTTSHQKPVPATNYTLGSSSLVNGFPAPSNISPQFPMPAEFSVPANGISSPLQPGQARSPIMGSSTLGNQSSGFPSNISPQFPNPGPVPTMNPMMGSPALANGFPAPSTQFPMPSYQTLLSQNLMLFRLLVQHTGQTNVMEMLKNMNGLPAQPQSEGNTSGN
ncbi:hypothetical protein B9Z55_003711 [Caenorhabditis nigoni]|uniref:T-box domain-containing protein n=1 Tax=Caenorhabditis nigoni TaxID=1611254 RepID=A0A2G5VS21_9PELO|nr:hypothetical protein B9Z55_003711 [Caenorhabditis nigoni]